MDYWGLHLIASIICSFCILGTHQLQSSQIQVLLQLRKHLEYPAQLEVWNYNKDNICFLSPSTKVNVTCEGDVVTQLRIIGDRPSPSPSPKLSSFHGYPIPNQTLSQAFSMDSFVATLARLTSLRVLSLVSLGIWGPLPNKIDRLTSLEFLDLSSNFLHGSIPPRIDTMVKLQTLRLDANFFNDSVPNLFDSLPSLSILSLASNQLEGPFPDSILKVSSLNTLVLSNNRFSGKLPDLDGLSELKVLDLSGNEFDSELPNLPNGLFMALLSNNSFHGQIPRGFEQLNRIEHLDLSLNHLQGRMPTFLFSLPNIGYLNLASNELTGSLPYHLGCGERLGFVDISNNRLTGGIPECLRKTAIQIYGNCLTVDVHNQHPQSYCAKLHSRKKSATKSAIILVGVIGGIIMVVGILALGFLVFCRRYCPGGCQEQHLLQKQVKESYVTGVTSEILANARHISEATKAGTQGIPPCRMFALEELKEATRNFDINTLMGEGSRGKMYKGRLQNGTLVAIRCLSLSNKYTIRNLKLRLDLLAKLRHPHLVCLLGHCIDDGKKADSSGIKVFLVYEYLSNGNLRSHLSDTGQARGLKWSERLAVLNDIANAVQFLHTGVIPGFFNNRLKTNNILLDEHRRAKLSDYGFSIIYDDDESGVKGGSNHKSWQMKILEDDIYSFGFIMLDSLVKPSVILKRNEFLLKDLPSLSSEQGQSKTVDPTVLSTSTKESLATVISIATKCVSSESSTRPSFEDVLWNLQYAAQLQATADGDHRFNSPARIG